MTKDKTPISRLFMLSKKSVSFTTKKISAHLALPDNCSFIQHHATTLKKSNQVNPLSVSTGNVYPIRSNYYETNPLTLP